MQKISALCFAVVLTFSMLSGCASYQARNGTPQEKQDAKIVDCAASQAWIDQADSELKLLKDAGVVEGDAVRYWSLGSASAKLAMAAAGCPIKSAVGVIVAK